MSHWGRFFLDIFVQSGTYLAKLKEWLYVNLAPIFRKT